MTAGMTPAQAALTLGNWHYDHKAWPRAIENYRRAMVQGLDNPDVRTDLGSALRFSGEPQKVLEQYRIAQNRIRVTKIVCSIRAEFMRSI
jgi:uncharacterized protein HemY